MLLTPEGRLLAGVLSESELSDGSLLDVCRSLVSRSSLSSSKMMSRLPGAEVLSESISMTQSVKHSNGTVDGVSVPTLGSSEVISYGDPLKPTSIAKSWSVSLVDECRRSDWHEART